MEDEVTRMNGAPKKSPALEALDRVREAEERAKAIIREAQEKIAVQIAKEAAEAAEEIKQKSLAEAQKEAAARKKATLERAHREAEAIRAETEAELATLRRQAGAAFEEAVKKAGLKIRGFLGRESV
jgi:vacuolar-type H+-ATPase subunit H